MKVIIMGCGRVGEQVARLMTNEGHATCVIDYDAQALARLGEAFKGQRLCGIGFDRNILLQAGIEQADAFAATSSSDNVNITAARVARHFFHVPKVVARLYDPRRAEIYRRLGLVTISSTVWGAQRIYELLTHREVEPVYSFGNGQAALVQVEAPLLWQGRTAQTVSIPGAITVAAITRDGQAFVPTLGAVFHTGDVVHLVVSAEALEQLESLLGLA